MLFQFNSLWSDGLCARSAFCIQTIRPALFGGLILCLGSGLAAAQTYSASSMWGASVAGGFGSSGGTDDSAANHLALSAASNYVDAAKAGVILNPNLSSNLTIQSVGSQTIVSNTVSGSNNSTSISATQSSTNSGATTNRSSSQ